MRVFLDACIIIYSIEAVAPHGESARRALASAPDAALCTTELVRLEVLSGAPTASDDAVRRKYEDFLGLCDFVPLDRQFFDRAIRLAVTHQLKALDAMHLAAGVAAGCDEFWTNDKKLANMKQVESMRIRRLP